MNHYHRGLHRFTVGTSLVTFFLILAGALVTSNDAGLSVPDWPLSHGQLMPEMSGGVFYEHGHRMVAATVGVLTILLNLWLWKREPRRWVRRLGLLALAAVVIQGILGGITVLFFLPTPVSVLHAALGQLFFCLLIVLAAATSPGWADLADGRRIWAEGIGNQWPLVKRALLSVAAVYLQLLLGALLRHSGTVNGSKGAVLVSWALGGHLLGALLVVAAIGTTGLIIIKAGGSSDVVGWVYLQLGLLAGQLVLGVGAYLARVDLANRVQPTPLKVWVTTGHVALGALLLATSLLLALKLARCRPDEGQGRWELAKNPA